MSFFPQRLRSKSISSPLGCGNSASQSCPNLLDLDEDIAGVKNDLVKSSTAHTPGPELLSLSMTSSPKGSNKQKKLQKTFFLLPTKFRQKKERRAQSQALKLPVFPLMDPLSEDSPDGADSGSQDRSSSIELPFNVRPKHTRPTGLGISLQGLLGSDLPSSSANKMRRGSDSCILSPSSERNNESIAVTDSEQPCDSKYLAHRRNTVAPPSSVPPIFIVVSRTLDKAGSTLSTDPLKRYLGKSFEQLPTGSSMNSEVGPFRTEFGADCRDGELCMLQHALLENPESETRWYFKYFLGKVHYNYLCYDNDKSPFFLSCVFSNSLYRCILWRKTGNKRLIMNQASNGKWPTPKSILEKFSVSKYDKNVKEVTVATIQKDLLTLEEQEGAVNFKFGVLYAKAGQTTDNEMFSNEHGSERFQNFVELLGDQVRLEGWQQFRGGLDTKNGSTGKTSVYTVYEGHEIMFHVSTLLPYSEENKQQLERKRHIGNDIVVIIFVDHDDDPEDAITSAMHFDPTCMKSHFNHIFALVTYDDRSDQYKLVIHSAMSVPEFGPLIPPGGEFADHTTFRDFLLAKLINGEKAAYCTPTFAEKRERTLGLLLKEVEQKCNTEYRRALSTPVLPGHSPNASRKLMDRETSFTDFGQRLKVEKIITGHHPTSQRTTVAPKRDPWETECVVEEFPYKIVYGDCCGDDTLIVYTHGDGTYIIFRDGSYSLVIDKSVPIGQMAVASRHQMLIFLTNYTKESNYLYAVPLKEFYTEKIKVGTKASLNPYSIPYTKGAHLFCCAPLESQFLRLAVAVKTKIYMIAYKHAATMTVNGSPMTPSISSNPMENFIKHRELALPDFPVCMTLLDERPSGKVCVSYQKQTVVDAIDEIKATALRIPNLDIAKGKLTTLSAVHENGRSELLIGYNLTCQLISILDGMTYNSTEIVWNAEPKDIVYMSPYVLAFTADTVEIRMASNGSLIQTIAVPDLQLLSKKGDLYFASSCNMIQSNTAKTPTPTRPCSMVPTKFPKNIDKKDFSSSTRLNEVSGLMYIYRITMQKMTGRIRSESSSSLTSSQTLHRSGSDEISIRTSVSEIIAEEDSLDDVHPILGEDDQPLMMSSFGSESPPDTGLRSEDSSKPVWQRKSSPVFYENVEIGSESVGRQPAISPSVPRRRTKAISGHGWNNCIPQYSRFSSSSSHSKVNNGSHSSNGRETSPILSSDSRFGQVPVIDLICSSPDSGVHDDYVNSATTPHSPHGHSVPSPILSSCKMSNSHSHSTGSPKAVHSHAILVNNSKGVSCHSTESMRGTVTSEPMNSDPRLKFTRCQTAPHL